MIGFVTILSVFGANVLGMGAKVLDFAEIVRESGKTVSSRVCRLIKRLGAKRAAEIWCPHRATLVPEQTISVAKMS